jgi:hypothetical protein
VENSGILMEVVMVRKECLQLRIFLCGVLLLFGSGDLYAFGSNYTHPQITEKAIEYLLNEGLDLRLQRQLGLSQGMETPVRFSDAVLDDVPVSEITRNNDVIVADLERHRPTEMGRPYSLRYLLISGSEAEDHPTERAQHHFHDPVSNQGLDNNVYGVGTLADFLTLLYPPATQKDAYRVFCDLMDLCEPNFHLDGTSARERASGKTSASYPQNYFAWPDSRRYFYKSLTGATPEERDHFLAMTFFSLGHAVHLLEDMGVPAHVRNDFLWDHIWSGAIRGHNLEGFLDRPDGVERYAYSRNPVLFSDLPHFWDNDGIEGTPGLAEYVNRNFLSEGTVFRIYRDPQWTGEAVYAVTAPDGRVDRVRYLTGRTTDGEEVGHLAAAGLLYSIWKRLGNPQRAGESSYLDPSCYDDYARILIPRVTSYVSGLIQYFFRGELVLIPEGDHGFRIKNLSGEPLTGGRFEILTDEPGGLRAPLASFNLSASSVLGIEEETPRIDFQWPPMMPRPSAYAVVYRGRLGEEEDAVIGEVTHPKVLFVTTRRGSEEIFEMDPDGTASAPIVTNGDPAVSYGHPSLSPDGRLLAFHSDKDGEDGVYIMDTDTREIRKIGRGYWPSWSPRGREVIFQRTTVPGKHDLFIVDVVTLVETRLTQDDDDNIYPAWSPDGTRIVYSSRRDGQYQLVVMERSGDVGWVAAPDNRGAFKPSWSPDGSRIVFERPSKATYQGGESPVMDIHVVDLTTGVERALTTLDTHTPGHVAWAGAPAWSLDGQEILYEFWESGMAGSDIQVMDANTGTVLRNLTGDFQADDGYPTVILGEGL